MSTDRRVGSDAHVAVWAAIQQYVVACGGDPNQVTDGRMNAVTAIERAVDRRVVELASTVPEALADRIRRLAPFDCVTTNGDGKATMHKLGSDTPNAVCSSLQVAHVLQDALIAVVAATDKARAISDATAAPSGGEWALVAAMRDATARLAIGGDPSSINKGRCDEWANRVAAAVPGATAVWLDSIIDADDFPIDAQPRVGHCVVEYAGRWYDSEHPLGVDDVGLLAGLDRGALATAARGTVGGPLADC